MLWLSGKNLRFYFLYFFKNYIIAIILSETSYRFMVFYVNLKPDYVMVILINVFFFFKWNEVKLKHWILLICEYLWKITNEQFVAIITFLSLHRISTRTGLKENIKIIIVISSTISCHSVMTKENFLNFIIHKFVMVFNRWWH